MKSAQQKESYNKFIIFVIPTYIWMNKYTKPTLHKLEEVFRNLHYTVRYEKGTFNSGYCMVEENKMVVINKFFDTDGRVNILLEIMNSIVTDESQLDDKSLNFYRNLIKKQDVIYKKP